MADFAVKAVTKDDVKEVAAILVQVLNLVSKKVTNEAWVARLKFVAGVLGNERLLNFVSDLLGLVSTKEKLELNDFVLLLTKHASDL